MQQGASANASTSAATGIGVSLAKAVELRMKNLEQFKVYLQKRFDIYYLYPCRTSCPKSSTCFFFSDISIFLRRKYVTRISFSPIFQYFLTCMPCAIDS